MEYILHTVQYVDYFIPYYYEFVLACISIVSKCENIMLIETVWMKEGQLILTLENVCILWPLSTDIGPNLYGKKLFILVGI